MLRRLAARFPSVLLSIAAAAAVVACGGRTESDLPGGSDDLSKSPPSSERSDAGAPPPAPSATATSSPAQPGDPFPICPSRTPAVGDGCTTVNQGCAYVDYKAGTCVSFTCDANGKWQSSTPAGC